MSTFDDIFQRWVNEGTLTQDDVIPILQEYVEVFEKEEFNPQIALVFTQMVSNQWVNGQSGLSLALNNALKMTGIKKGYHWAEVLDQQGNLLKRIWQPQDGKIQN
jgi:hypothetical protein